MNNIQCTLPDCDPSLDEEIKGILRKYKRIAIVGLSPKEARDSNRVARYLINNGYEIVPVNPGQEKILGKRCYKTLRDIPFQVDVVDLFLNSARVPPIVDQAIAIGAKVIWMQLGVVHNEAAEKARKAGIQVIMNRCIKQDHKKMG